MPLRMTCKGCDRDLVLDNAFQGAHCRCRHCRRLLAVPRLPNTTAARSAVRPSLPSPIVAYTTAAPRRANKGPARSPVKPRNPVLARITTFRAVAAFCFTGVAMLGVTAWVASGTSSSGNLFPVAWQPTSGEGDVSGPAQDIRSIVLNADPRSAYFGVPVAGEITGYVVDCDETMLNHIDGVSTVTETLNTSFEPGTHSFGIVQAINDPDSRRLTHVYDPKNGLADAKTVFDASLAGGTTDLPRALALTEPWFADQIFLVLSKHVDASDIELLIQSAQQSGAVTHVIAMGEAASQGDELSRISDATGGKFVPISDALLEDLVKRCQDQSPDESR